MPKRKRGITGDAASRREAIRKRERRVVETEEERSRRLSTMAQRGQDRRAEETEEQRNSRLSNMAQSGQEKRAEETEEQRKENTFWGEQKEELQGMLPVDGRQLENVKGELLKLKKKEAADCPTMAQRGQDRRAEETEEQRNSRLVDYGTT
ncbi:hypothetical protein AVEN_65573-1 [Araneus ventricosus]|uniref:STPR domain-containing protein n=1 Tax=Araneus ventricosus TaxID=182803 RepID=A0A4Y2F2A0_ARAVE|nr:hypothetical protein AVEN_65573-1 [Araneus ventricosus]